MTPQPQQPPASQVTTPRPAQPVLALLALATRLERRQGFALGGLALYAFATVYTAALGLQSVAPPVWVRLYWALQLFVAVAAAARVFAAEPEGRQLYLYTLVHPAHLWLAKAAYATAVQLALSLLSLGAMAFTLGWPFVQLGPVLLAVGLGAFTLATTLTLVAALAERTGARAPLVAILGFPLLLPQVLSLNRLTQSAVFGLIHWDEVLQLAGLGLGLFALGWVLFPYVWRD